MMPVPVSDSGLVTTRRPVPALTPRQMDVLRLAARGLKYREIADELGIGFGTVKRTVHDILERCSVETLVEAFAAAGWLVVPAHVRGVDRRYPPEDDGSTWTVTTAGYESVTLP